MSKKDKKVKPFEEEKYNYKVYFKQSNGRYRLLDRNDVYTTLERLPNRTEKFTVMKCFKFLSQKRMNLKSTDMRLMMKV